jgi:hypothetical protein
MSNQTGSFYSLTEGNDCVEKMQIIFKLLIQLKVISILFSQILLSNQQEERETFQPKVNINNQKIETHPLKINRRIENNGFHRFLITDINFERSDYDKYFKDCKWILAESFDASLYVDINELKQKQYEQSYRVYLSNKVNTETAEYKSRSFKLFIYINQSLANCNRLKENTRETCEISIKLPIHLRYHGAKTSSSGHMNKSTLEHIEITLKKPKVFVDKCSAHFLLNQNQEKKNSESDRNYYSEQSDLEDLNYNYLNQTIELPCEKNASANNDYLIYISNFNRKSGALQYQLKKIQIDYMNFFEKICQWNEITFSQMFLSDVLTVSIPIANRDHEPIVLIASLVTFTLLSLALARCIQNKIVDACEKSNIELETDSESEEDEGNN